MQDRMTEDKPTRVPARANRWWNQPSAIGLGGTEGLTGVLGDRAKSVLLLGRAPTDWKAGCGRSARPVWEGGGAHRAPPILIGAGHSGRDHWDYLRGRKGCVAREVGRASSLPVPGASCPKFLEGRADRTPTRGWKPLETAGGDAGPSAPEKALGWSSGSPLSRGGAPCGIEP